MENQAKALQQPAINGMLDQDDTQQVLFSEAELNAGMDFLRAAGLAPAMLAGQGTDSRAVSTNSGLADTLKSMGMDIANKMEEFWTPLRPWAWILPTRWRSSARG